MSDKLGDNDQVTSFSHGVDLRRGKWSLVSVCDSGRERSSEVHDSESVRVNSYRTCHRRQIPLVAVAGILTTFTTVHTCTHTRHHFSFTSSTNADDPSLRARFTNVDQA